MSNYLGEFELPPGNKYESYKPADWAMEFISSYGQCDGAHHKNWVLDQAARCLHGCPVRVVEARWESGKTNIRFSTVGTTAEYEKWVKDMRQTNEDGEDMYGYDVGIAP